MAIKVQVKDNRGCTSTFTDRCNGSFVADGYTMNTTGMPNFGVGVTPINTFNTAGTNGYGTCIQPMAFETSCQAEPFVGGINDMNLNAVPTIIGRIAAMDPALGHVASQIATIDPMFIASLGTVAGGCAWTAAKLVQVAKLDLDLARKIVKVAIVNPQEALAFVQTALVNPVLAARQLASLGLGWNTQSMTAAYPWANGFEYSGPKGSTMPIDVYEDGKAWIIEADLPGVSIDDVDISAANGRLIIEAFVARSSRRPSYASMLHCESRTPRVLRREFAIGLDVETTEISARIVNGVLSIVLPKKIATSSEQFVSREGALVS
ncbi:MAG: Hsp20/alpha crystallin family protein [Phycisphaerales bacterium]|jgi:HSP20 family protein|nr:Hsp20/alpha crystallin family protein [Phycisphaerales bacterium]